MLSHQRELTLPRLTVAPTANSSVCLTLQFLWRQSVEPFDSFGEESIAGHAKRAPRYVFNYVATAETELLFLTHRELHHIARTYVDETDELVGRVHGRFKTL